MSDCPVIGLSGFRGVGLSVILVVLLSGYQVFEVSDCRVVGLSRQLDNWTTRKTGHALA